MSWIRHKKPSRVRPVRGRLGRRCERLSIQSHLAYCELKLRLRTRPDQIARLRLLDHLHRYWQAGCFPEHRFHTPGRRPVFIDDSGTYCAVGYLMAQSGARGLAAAINRDDRFAYIEDLDLSQHPEIRSWLLEHELSQTEAALIQPTYADTISHNLFESRAITVILGFWLICFLVLLLRVIDTISEAHKLQYGKLQSSIWLHPTATTRPIRWIEYGLTVPIRWMIRWIEHIKVGLTVLIRGGINPIETTHRHKEDTKPIEATHQTWYNDFSLLRKRLRRQVVLIIALNLAYLSGHVVVISITLTY